MKCNILPLRDVVIYPGVVTPLFVGRKKSIQAIEEAAHADMRVVLLSQKSPETENPSIEDVYKVGTLGNIIQMMRLPDGTVKLLVEGIERVNVNQFIDDDLLACEYTELASMNPFAGKEVDSIRQTLLETFERYIKTQKKQPKEVIEVVEKIDDLSKLVDVMASHVQIKVEKKVEILVELDIDKRITLLMAILESELNIVELERSLRNRVKKQMDKNQREYYLNEQAKAIQKELEELDGEKSDFGALETAIKDAKMPEEAEKKCLSELDKLKRMPAMSSEATVIRNYIEVMIDFPWSKSSENSLSLSKTKDTLEQSHYGLDEVKKRIIEHIAVQLRKKKPTGSILCLVGPPGVGKTSIAKSIAEAMGREYIRMSLGGVRDEAEIRGHRRTYIGSMPGKIVQQLTKSKVNNPLFLLDEIDKMGMDHRGDPASAMLEVLDPEQNHAFNDHYMEVDIDLSNVMFMATANSLDIPGPLRDRMEIIRIPGYTEHEKLAIAKKYLINKNLEKAGLDNSEINITDRALEMMIESYTREAGVRGLDREINKICRRVVTEITLDDNNKSDKVSVSRNNLEHYLGAPKYQRDEISKQKRIGVINGLAWTSVGGELLNIEVAIIPGKGLLRETGTLGDVMKESILAAMSVIKLHADLLGVSQKFFQEHDFHIHLPEGATPKDGPSAGIALATALLSAVMREPIATDIAMTGELTLQGRVLPIGGLKEKLFAATREGIKKVFIPKKNEKDLQEIPLEIKNKLMIYPISEITEVFAEVFSSHLNIKNKNTETKRFVDAYLKNSNEITQKH